MPKIAKKTPAKKLNVTLSSRAKPRNLKLDASIRRGGLGMTSGLKTGFNPEQREAIEHKNGPMLVIAGAGTGKTRVITERIAHILNSGWCKNGEVLALTFTEKAAAEIEERVDRLMPLGYEPVPIHTFHGFCDKILREFGVDIGLTPGYQILSGVPQWMFMKEHLFEFELDYYRPLGNPTAFIDALLNTFSRFKEELNSPEMVQAVAEKEAEPFERQRLMELTHAYAKYQQLLTENDFLDFADLHYKMIELFQKRPAILRHLQERYQYVLVDEYQDTNIAQNKIVDLLVAKHRNLMVVGDDDQSIYKFRGAAISNIIQFAEEYKDSKKIVLTQNYRSNQKILDLAYASIQHNNPDRLEVQAEVSKKLVGRRPGTAESIKLVHASTIEQEVDFVIEEILLRLSADQNDRGAGVPLNEIAILCRANVHAQPFVEALKKANISYSFVSERGLYRKAEIQDLIAVLRVLANPSDDISFYALMRMPVWGVKMEQIATLIPEAKRHYHSVWAEAKKAPECQFLMDTLKDCVEFSRNHTAGETLYRFTETIKLTQQLLQAGTIEAEEKITNIATFFNKILEFERGNTQNSVIDFVAYLDMAEEAGENPSAKFENENDGVFVSTVHGAKGLEFNTVFLPSLTNDRFPSVNRKDPIAIPDALVHEILTGADTHVQEERRLFYVACTRAKENLFLLHSDYYGPSASANPRKKKRSRFIDEVIEQVSMTQIEKTSAPFVMPSRAEASGLDASAEPALSTAEVVGMTHAPTHITQFSYSQLTTFKTCPRQYQYQYLFKIPQPPDANFSFGSTMHATLQEFYKNVQQTRQAALFTEFEPDMSLARLLEIYESKWIDRGYESKAHMDLRRARGREILTLFHEKFKQEVTRVRFLEKGFKLKIGDYTLSGRLDRADDLPDGTLEIIDYKTGRSKSETEVAEDLQLFIYALAAQECFGLKASRLTLYFLDDDKRVSVEPDSEKMETVKTEVRAIADQINRSDFAPTPSQHKCQYCPFSKICDASAA